MNRRRWLLALWACGMAALLTLPWVNFRTHAHWAKVQWVPFVAGLHVRDVILNVLAFVPCGYLLAAERFRSRTLSLFAVVLVAAMFSIAGELYQVFNHRRFPSATDVASNALGAYLGWALAALRQGRRAM